MFRLPFHHLKNSLIAATLAVTVTAPALAADTSPLMKDLTASIALLGLPCGQVISITSQGERDHLATCSDGNRYRVYVNAQGRVTAEKR